MKAAAVLLCLTLTPAFGEGAAGDVDRGFSLMEQGTRLLLRGLADQIEPDLQEMMRDMGPALLELRGMMDDLGAYGLPEMLPNGDIIIRRKVPLVPVPGGEVDL